jgi:hypothetical protein
MRRLLWRQSDACSSAGKVVGGLGVGGLFGGFGGRTCKRHSAFL